MLTSMFTSILLTPMSGCAAVVLAGVLAASPDAGPETGATPDAEPAADRAAEGPAEPPPALLLVDPGIVPHVELAWTTRSGQTRFEIDHAYSADSDRSVLGANIECYVSVGGTRISKNAGHPKGATVRVGFYKIDAGKPFFEGLVPGSVIEVRFENVAFNQAIDPDPETLIQHAQFRIEDLEACGLPGDARDQFNTFSEHETLNDRVVERDLRPGALSQDGAGATFERVDERTVSLEVRFPYGTLRHARDPWDSVLPGTFLEPNHFHLEFEVLPEGVEPMDRDAMRERRERELEQIQRSGDPTVIGTED